MVAVSVWGPSAVTVESQVIEYVGPVTTSAPRAAPSSLNWTPSTLTLSVAVALTVTLDPETVALGAGTVNAPVGGVASTTHVHVAGVGSMLPAGSIAATENM